MTIPRSRSGARRGDLQRRVGAERGAHHHRLSDLQVVHQGDQLLGEGVHRIAPHVAGAVRFAVAKQVNRDHAVAARRKLFGKRPVHLLGEQQAVHEDHRSLGGRGAPRGLAALAVALQLRRAPAELGVGDALVVEAERRHLSS